MQTFPGYTPASTSTTTNSPIYTRHQQLTPAPSVVDEEISNRQERPRTLSDPSSSSSREDDYYFYHKGMNSRRHSLQSLGRRPEDEQKRESTEQVRLPPITSLLATVEPPAPYATPRDPRDPQTPHYVPADPRDAPPIYHREPPPTYPRDPREAGPVPPSSHYPPPPPHEPLPPYQYSTPPTSYPYHTPYRRPSIFSTYSSSTGSSPRPASYVQPPTSQPLNYRTPSPPYRSYPGLPPPPSSQPPVHSSYGPPPPHLHHHHHHHHAHLQPRPPHIGHGMPQGGPPSTYLHHSISLRQPPGSFALTHRTNSASPAERYMCHECNKSFSRPSSLRIHTFSHTGEKPFVCPEPGCTKRFSVRSNMRRHMKVHSEQGGAGSTGMNENEPHEMEREELEGGAMSETSGSPPMRPQGSRSSI